MPTLAAPKPCTQPGCGVLVRDGSSRCPAHKVRAGTFADERRGSRHERGYGSAWDKLRLQIIERDNGLCQPCLKRGRVHQGTHVDHIVNKVVARRLGWTDEQIDAPANLQCICRTAHRAKTQGEAGAGRAAGAGLGRTAVLGPPDAPQGHPRGGARMPGGGGVGGVGRSPGGAASGPTGSPDFCARRFPRGGIPGGGA